MITIVVASYRYGHLAAHCIETLLAQSTAPKQIIFVDDGVGDCAHLSSRYPEIDFVFREKNLGIIANFQEILFNRIATKYCMYIGADNWLRSDAIEMMNKIISIENNPDIVTYDMILTGELKQPRLNHHHNEITRFNGDYYWQRRSKHHGSMLYNVELAKSVGGYSALEENKFHTAEDESLWNKMIRANGKESYIEQGLLYYRHHRDNYNKY